MNKKQIARICLAAISTLSIALHAIPQIRAHEVQASALTITGAFSRATLPNAPVGGGYLTIANAGAEPDRLVSATSPAAGEVQLHEMTMEGDVMKMRPLDGGIEIPAGGSVTLQPGGLHMMFTGLEGPFVEGETVPVTLQFEKAGAVEISLPVLGTAAKSAPMDHSSH